MRKIARKATEISYHGQHYHVLERADYVRKDGTPSLVATLRTWCADCGRKFELTSATRFRALTRRCQACKAPGRRVGSLCRCPACKAKRKRLKATPQTGAERTPRRLALPHAAPQSSEREVEPTIRASPFTPS